MIYSIVRTKQPGHPSSYPVGSFEVYFVDADGKTADNPESAAHSIAETFNRCRYDQYDNRLWYSVELVDDESPDRKPTEEMLRDSTVQPTI